MKQFERSSEIQRLPSNLAASDCYCIAALLGFEIKLFDLVDDSEHKIVGSLSATKPNSSISGSRDYRLLASQGQPFSFSYLSL